jgi:hypothetical protein
MTEWVQYPVTHTYLVRSADLHNADVIFQATSCNMKVEYIIGFFIALFGIPASLLVLLKLFFVLRDFFRYSHRKPLRVYKNYSEYIFVLVGLVAAWFCPNAIGEDGFAYKSFLFFAGGLVGFILLGLHRSDKEQAKYDPTITWQGIGRPDGYFDLYRIYRFSNGEVKHQFLGVEGLGFFQKVFILLRGIKSPMTTPSNDL